MAAKEAIALEEPDPLQPLLRLRRQLGGRDPEAHCGVQQRPSSVPEYSGLNVIKALSLSHSHSSWFVLGSCLLVVSLSVAFYCIIYLEWYCGIEDYDASYPTLIPITTASFIAATICFNISLWPAWSFLTPLVLFTQFMGIVMLVSLLG
ncbi:hypothetical protein lerEdw1_019151 [Lerista edwardsae]|nr:hypothetical protein lerEdw1_019151 [Lerista edwardsae]